MSYGRWYSVVFVFVWYFAILNLGASGASTVGPFESLEDCERTRQAAMVQAPDTVSRAVSINRSVPGGPGTEAQNPRFLACWSVER